VALGRDRPVAVMGALNVSPESFYPGSVHVHPEALLDVAQAMVEAGAVLIDVGARSTAPYLPTAIDEADEVERLRRAVGLLAPKLAVPISADTASARPARAALEAGALVINDVSGLADPALARVVAEREVGVIAMASPSSHDAAPDPASNLEPVVTVAACLRRVLTRARAAGIRDERIVLDPGIGFFREGAVSWVEWDASVIAHLECLLELDRPLCVAVSRKSFIGAIAGRASPGDRLAGSLAATALAVAHGASLIRTHDVAETIDAVRVAARICAGGFKASREPVEQ
jgi:dihydropteroate synthase